MPTISLTQLVLKNTAFQGECWKGCFSRRTLVRKGSLWRNKTNIDGEGKITESPKSQRNSIFFIYKNMYKKNASAKLCMKHIGFIKRSKF